MTLPGRAGGRPGRRGGRRRSRHPRGPAGAAGAASAWRRRLRRPRLPLVRVAAALALLALVVPQLPAQEAGGDAGEADAAAVLVSGPARRQSLPFLPPNTIEYQLGVYELSGPPASEPPPSPAAASAATVEVFYTEAPVFRRRTWTETSCDDRAVHVLPEAGGTLVHYTWPGAQRHAFFRFAPPADATVAGDMAAGDAAAPGATGAAPGDAGAAAAVARSECDFIEVFLDRFSFFLDTTDAARVAPFPAVLPP